MFGFSPLRRPEDRDNRSIHNHNAFKVNAKKLKILNEWESLYYATIRGEGWEAPGKNKNHLQVDAYNSFSLVHMIRNPRGDVYNYGFETLLNTWDVISCSLVRLRSPGDSTIASVGFALRVPPQNIIGAHAADVWVDNHAGADFMSYRKGCERTQTSALLSENILNNRTLKGHISKVNGGVKSLTDVRAPAKLVSRRRDDHNEVLAIGRPGINIYDFTDLPKDLCDFAIDARTAPIKVRFILINPDKRDFEEHRNRPRGIHSLYAKHWRQAIRLRDRNPGLKIKVVQHKAPGWDWSQLEEVAAGDGFID